jgi:hypothetical protein
MKILQSHRCFNWLLTAQKKVAVAVALICLTVSATSCRSVNEIVKEVPVHDTTYITNTQRDSTYIDRWHTEYIKGDTVWKKDSVLVVRWRDRSDTVRLYVEKPVEVEKIVKVEKKLNFFQKTLMWFGVGFILVLIGFGISLYVKLKG